MFDHSWFDLISWTLQEAVYLGGLITAFFTWRKNPHISLIVATAMGGLLLITFHLQWQQAQPDFTTRFVSMSEEQLQWYNWLQSVPYTVVFLVLTVTALTRRRPRNPAIIFTGEEGSHD
jgi:hypothetical protein